LSQDGFGGSVSVSGDTAVVTSPGKAAYVFVRNGSAWSQQAELTPSDGINGDGFAADASLDGDTVVVGASGRNNEGATYVFTRTATTWSQQAELMASDAASGDAFG
jgi:hypothetical protein